MTTLIAVALFSIWPFSQGSIKEEIVAIHNQAKIQFRTDPDSATSLVKLALMKSEDADYAYGVAKSHYMLGSAADQKGKAAMATSYFLNALQLYEGLEDAESWSVQANIYLTMGKIFWQHHKAPTAMGFYEQGTELALKANNNKALVRLLHNAAFAHRSEGNYGLAAKLLRKKMSYIKQDNIDDKLKTYNELGAGYYEQKNYELANDWFNKMLEIEEGSGSRHFRGQALHNLANIEKERGNYAKAWNLFKRALLAFGQSSQPRDLFLSYQDMAKLAQAEGNMDVAMEHAEQASILINQLPNLPEYYDHYEFWARSFETLDLTKSYAYLKIYTDKDRAFDLSQKSLIAKIEGYKLDLVLANHEKQLQQQAQQKKLTYTIISLLLLSLMIYVYMDYRKRKYRLYLIEQISFFVKDRKLLKKL